MLTDPQRRALVALARASVAARVVQGALARAPGALITDVPLDVLPPASGVFVTLKQNGALRGCLGTLECLEGLAGEVARCAAQSASEDPRFPPVTRAELLSLSYEVSVLGPLERVDPVTPLSIIVGVHGLVIEQGHRHGLLLPQVASERHWSAEEFLGQTCVKAKLDVNAWRRGASVYRFVADVFGDDEPS